MRYWLDTEFVEQGHGHSIDLISLGIVAEDGRELYLESSDFDKGKANQWVRAQVLPHLKGGESRWPLKSIKVTLLDFFDPTDYGKPELWAWCGAYDWVVFCQIFGTMMDLPQGYPHYIHEFQQMLDTLGITDDELPQQESGAHNALEDARHLKRLWGYVIQNDAWQ